MRVPIRATHSVSPVILLLHSVKLDLTNIHCSREKVRVLRMHITKSYYFLWWHEEKQGQFSTFTGTPLVTPASLYSSLQTVLWLQGSSPQFSSKTLNSVRRSLHGEDSQPSPDASTHNQVILKNNEGNKNHRQMTWLQQVYYGTVMLWPQVRNQMLLLFQSQHLRHPAVENALA